MPIRAEVPAVHVELDRELAELELRLITLARAARDEVPVQVFVTINSARAEVSHARWLLRAHAA